MDNVPVPVLILRQSGKCLHPVAGVQIVDVTVIRIGRMVDVAANHSVALARPGKLHQFFFKRGYIRNGRLHFLFDGLEQRIVWQAVALML